MASSLNPEIQRTNRLFDALGTEWRRRVLLLLRDGGSHQVADLTDDEAPGVRIQLVHADLPKLADGGYVEWDRESGALAKGPQFGELEPFLQVLYGHQVPAASGEGDERPWRA